MSDDPRKGDVSASRRSAQWTAEARHFLTGLITSVTRPHDAPARTAPQPSSPSAWRDLPRDIAAVVDRLAGPDGTSLIPAATRLQPLTAADLAALDGAVDMQLAALTGALRLQHAALSTRVMKELAVREAIDLPQAMRTDVHATRGTVPRDAAQ